MQSDREFGGDELGRTMAALVRAASSALDMADLWRVIADLHAVEAGHERDLRATRDDGAFPEDEALDLAESGGGPPVPSGPVVLLTRINATAASFAMQAGMRWQELLSRRIPEIRRCLDEYRSEEDPSPATRARLVDEMRRLLRDVGEFAVDQGHEVQSRLNRIEVDLFPSGSKDRKARVVSGKRKN